MNPVVMVGVRSDHVGPRQFGQIAKAKAARARTDARQ